MERKNPLYGLLAQAIRAYFETEYILPLAGAYDLWGSAYRRDKIKRQLELMVARGELIVHREPGRTLYASGPNLETIDQRPLGRARGPRKFDWNRAVALKASGLSHREIAKRLGVSKSAVSAWLRQNPPLEEPSAPDE